jgi:glycosyltransferase involved in cell wall biosynthesis
MNTFSIPEEKITLIHNGIQLEEPQRERSQWRKALRIDEERFSAVMVANLQSFKDHPTLLEAWRRVINKTVKEQGPILFLAGRFDDTYSQLKFQVNELKLGDSVRFLGEVADISGLLKAVDLSVFSSKFEGCPNSVLESMAAGLAVVATDITGTAEALGDDYPFLVPINNSDSFAKHILTFISDENLRQKIGEQNYQRISTLFKPEQMYEAYKDLLLRILRLSR